MNQPGRTDILLGSITLSSTVFFFVPFALFLLNRESFFAAPHIVAGILLAFTTAATLIFATPLFLTKGTLRFILLALVAFLSIGVWMQANLLNWDYGLLDGSALRWRLLEKRSLIDVATWFALFMAISIVSIRKEFPLRYLFFILIFMQLGNILFIWFNPATDTTRTGNSTLSITDKDRFNFSSNKNVVLMVLDAYQTDIFNEYLEKNPEVTDTLPGFTYYPDAVSEHFYTSRSIATLLTGNYLVSSSYEKSNSQKEHRNELFREHSIPALLKNAGYHVGLYPFYARNNYPPEVFGGIADNYVHTNLVLQEGASEIATLLEVSLFRVAAHPFKRMIYNRFLLTPSYDQDRDEFAIKMHQQLQAGLDTPAFKYYHLQGMHGPHIIDGKRYDEQKRESALLIAERLNQMLANFAAKLQQAGAYDQSDIFIVGDHGLYRDSHSLVLGQYARNKTENTRPLDDFVKKCRALPIFLYKPANATGPLRVLKTPVCLADILPSITEITGAEKPELCDGAPIQTLSEDAERIRYHFTRESRRGKSINPDYEFYITGFSWYDKSWTYTGNLHTYNTIDRIPLNNYISGQQLTFGVSGTGKQYLDNNWQEAKNYHNPLLDKANLKLPISTPSTTMVLEMGVAPITGNRCTISISVNKSEKKLFSFSDATILKLKFAYDPNLKQTFAPDTVAMHASKEASWDWAPVIPTLSDTWLKIELKQENADNGSPINIKLHSLRIMSTTDE